MSYYRTLLNTETLRLDALAELWERTGDENQSSMSADGRSLNPRSLSSGYVGGGGIVCVTIAIANNDNELFIQTKSNEKNHKGRVKYIDFIAWN